MERSPVCGGPDAQRESNETEHRSPATDTNNTSGVEYVVAGRAANARQWGRVVTGTNSAGQTVVRTNVSYTEVGANLCFQDANGDLVGF